ncbi:positive regulation of extrinsic apoptotic signaling pathway via death domain receptors protein [Branchiostoma belcheri]|nr:positive regulation of extrinsic apoptotic signaling pathway via death domain receptors protein [Branchiostoma belcheri]
MSYRAYEQELLTAVEEGDVETVTELLQHGIDVNFGWFQNTPLHEAGKRGHVGVAELLLKAGAQVDSRDGLENTPLHNAALGGHVGVAELLFKIGAQVDSRDRFGNSPLHCAASGGHVGVAELLLKAGAQVDSRNEFGNTPLHKSAEEGVVGVAELLLKAGAQVDSRGDFENTPLHYAAEGHIGVAELLLKAGAQVDSRNKRGKTPENIAARTDVPSWCYNDKDQILKGRKMILQLLKAERLARTKVGPEGAELQTTSCTVTVPGGAVNMETEITCQVIDPNGVTIPLKDGEMLVSDIIELGPHGITFHQPVTVQIQYNSKSSGGARDATVWVTEDSQPKQDQFTVPTEEFTLTSSTQPAVQISFPEQAVTTPTQVTVQVQEVPKRAVEDMKAKDQSSRGLLSTSPIVKVESASAPKVQFHKPVTVRVPHPQHYMDIQHEGPTKLRVMSCEEGTEDWEDETDNTNIRVTEEFVEFEVSHFTRWIVIVVTDIYDEPEEIGPIPLHLCRWLQHREVQFILMQREDDANQFVVECAPTEDVKEKRTALLQEGYKGPVPTDTVSLFEGQIVEVSLLGNVMIPVFGVGNSKKQQITFHSQKSNRLHMQVMALEAKGQRGLDGKGSAAFFALPRVEVEKQKRRTAFLRRRQKELAHSPGKKLQDPTLLCQLPIHVPFETLRKMSREAEGDLEGVEKYFHSTKEAVSTGWMDLSFHLGFKGNDIANIAGRNRDDKSRCMDMLQEWKKKNGDAATIEVLMEALSEAELQSVVDGLKNKFPDIVTDTWHDDAHSSEVYKLHTDMHQNPGN